MAKRAENTFKLKIENTKHEAKQRSETAWKIHLEVFQSEVVTTADEWAWDKSTSQPCIPSITFKLNKFGPFHKLFFV